ncbi:MAG: hypothetical protein ACJAXS_000571 [Colwellia sp.]|jgi:hypothetical protein
MLNFFLKTTTFLIPVFFSQTFLYSPITKAEDILIYIRDHVYADYIKFVNGRDVLTIENF